MKGLVRLVIGLVVFASLAVHVASAACLDANVICLKVEIVDGQMANHTPADIKGKFKAEQCWKEWRCWWCVDGSVHAMRCNTDFPACEGGCLACGWSGAAISVPCYDKSGRSYYN